MRKTGTEATERVLDFAIAEYDKNRLASSHGGFSQTTPSEMSQFASPGLRSSRKGYRNGLRS